MIMDKFPHPPDRPGPLRGLAAAFFAFAVCSCIERSNPFDPINVGPKAGEEVRQAWRPELVMRAGVEGLFAAYLASYQALFARDAGAGDSLSLANARKRSGEDSIRTANASIDAANKASTNVDSLRNQLFFPSLDILRSFGPYPDFQTRRDSLHIRGSEVKDFMNTLNRDNNPLLVYGAAYIDSVLAPFKRDSLGFARLQERIDSGNAAVRDSNSSIRGYNTARAADNARVQGYNDSIAFLRNTHNKPVITNADSLTGKALAAQPGDSLLIGPGVFPANLRFSHSGTAEKPIVVRGYPSLGTVFKAFDKARASASDYAVFLDSVSFLRFENIVFRKGRLSGFKLDRSRGVTFRNCQFDSSARYGLEVIDGDADVKDSRFLANGGGGILQNGDGSQGYKLSLLNILVAGSGGHGLELLSPSGEITNCTLADNRKDGIHVDVPINALTISNTLVASNAGIGIYRGPDVGPKDAFVVRESDVWGNAPDWGPTAADSTWVVNLRKANLNIQPEFINPASWDYSLLPGSALSEYERQPLPVIIGYRP